MEPSAQERERMKSYSVLLPPEMQHAGKHLRIQKKTKEEEEKSRENNNALSHARLVVHRRRLVGVVRRLRHLSRLF